MKTAIIFLWGMLEFRSSFTWADPKRKGNLTELDYVYDHGREFAHFITFRFFEK